MDKAHITGRLLELTQERGGHIGYRAFLDATGITHSWLRGQPWFSGWNPLLAELGLQTKRFEVARSDSTEIAKSVGELIARTQRWPTDDQLRRERARTPSFPSLHVIARIRKTGELAKLISRLAESDDALRAVSVIALAQLESKPESVQPLPGEKIKGYVYMLRTGRRYKIGKSNDPSRRYREVKLELPDETHQVHTIATDDPAGIEAYWHARFASKRVRNTEFFDLDSQDIAAFKRRTYQ